MYADEQIRPGEAAMHEARLRRDYHRVGVLDQQCRDWRPVPDVAPVAGQHRPDARLVEDAGRRVEPVETLDQCEVNGDEAEVRIELPAALVGPGAGHRRQARDGEELRGAVA